MSMINRRLIFLDGLKDTQYYYLRLTPVALSRVGLGCAAWAQSWLGASRSQARLSCPLFGGLALLPTYYHLAPSTLGVLIVPNQALFSGHITNGPVSHTIATQSGHTIIKIKITEIH